MRAILNARGYDAPEVEIRTAWEAFSEDRCAGWHVLGGDDEIVFKTLMMWLEPKDWRALPSGRREGR